MEGEGLEGGLCPQTHQFFAALVLFLPGYVQSCFSSIICCEGEIQGPWSRIKAALRSLWASESDCLGMKKLAL